MKKVLPSLVIVAALMMSLAAQAQTTVVIGTGTSTSYTAPFNNFFKNSWSQVIYPSSEFSAPGNITEIAYNCSATASFTFSTLKIYMGTTSNATHATTTSWLPMTDLELVYDANNVSAPATTGWWTITLDTPFYYDAQDNLVIVVSKTCANYSSGLTFYYTSVTDSYLYRQSDSDVTYANHPGTATGTKSANRANITITMLPAVGSYCAKPLSVSVDTVTKHEANISWVPADSTSMWDLAYGLRGFNPDNEGTLVQGLTTTSYFITGLNAGSNYDVCVRTVCDADTGWYSSWKRESFDTDCDVIRASDLPYTEDFEAYGTGSANPINQCWYKGTNSSTAYPYPYSTAAINGSRGLYFYGYYPSSTTSTKIYSYAALPEIDTSLSVNSLTLRFNFKRYSGTTNYYHSLIQVGVMTDPTDASTFTAVETVDITGEAASSVHNFEVSLMPYSGTGKYIALYCPYITPTTTTYTYNYVYIDDIELIPSPSCIRPNSVVLSNVIDTAAVVSWTVVDTAQHNFAVAYGAAGTAPDSMMQVSATAPGITITGLTSGTEYDVYVKAVCSATDESEWSVKATFRTTTTPVVVTTTSPFTEDFENVAANDWILENGSCVNRWFIGQATSNGNTAGVQSMYISTDSAGTTNDYTFTTYALVYAYKTFQLGAGTYTLSYDWKAAGQTTLDFMRVALVPSSIVLTATDASALPTGFSATAMPEGWIPADGGGKLNLSSTWGTRTEDVLITQPGIYNLVFVWRNNNSTGTNPPAAVDNITLTQPSCPHPIDLVRTGMTSSAVTLAWTAAGSETEWAIRYRDMSDTTTWFTVNNVTTNPYTVSGLTTGNTYQFEVQAVCGANEVSAWEGPVETIVGVQTLVIGTGTSTGYYAPFYNYYKNSWTQSIYPATEFSVPGMITKIAYDCSAQASFTFTTLKIYMGTTSSLTHANTSSWLPMADLQLVYDHSNMSGPSATGWWELPLDTPFYYDASDNLVVVVSKTTGNYTSSLTFHYTSVTGSYLYRYSDSDLSYANHPGAATGTSGSYRANITVWMTMPDSVCFKPATLAVDSVDMHSAYVSWTSSDTVSLWELAYGATGFNPDIEGTHIQGLTTPSCWLTGLNLASNYDVCVRTICGTSFYSDWKRASFMTDCDVIRATDLPYIETFEAYGTGSGSQINQCWTKGTNSSTAYPYPYSTAAIHGQRGLYFYGYYPSSTSSTAIYSYAALPALDTSLAVNNMTLRFNFKRYSTTTDYYPNILQVGVMTNPSNVSTFVPVETVNISSAPASSINEIEVDLYNYTGTGRYIAIYCPHVTPTGSATYTYNYCYVDDIELVQTPTCIRPRDLVFTNVTQNSADVSWTIVDTTENNFVVAYGVAGTPVDSMATVTSTTTNVSFTGLAEATIYEVYVKAICSADDESEWSPVGSFHTTQTPFVISQTNPFVEDFETQPSWIFENGGFVNHWVIDTNTNNGGSYSMYITNDDSLKPNSYNASPALVVYAYRTLSLQAGVYEVSFDWKANGESSVDYLRAAVVPSGLALEASSGLPTGMNATSLPAGWLPIDGGGKLNLTTAWTTQAADLLIENAGIYNLVFVWRNDGSVVNMPPAAVDNISVVMPSCSKPYNMYLASFTNSAFTFHWTPGGTETMWDVRYKFASDTTWTVVAGLTDTTYVATNLAPVEYDFAVRANCGNGLVSSWSTSITVLPGAITIGEGASYSYLPFYGLYSYGYSQQIYLASEIHSPGLILSVGFYCSSLPAAGKTGAVRIWMGHTTKTDFASNTDYVAVNTLEEVYNMGTGVEWSNLHLGWNTIELDQPFVYNGVDNLVIAYYEGYPGYSSSSFFSHQTTDHKSIMHYSDTESYVSYTNPASASGTKIFNLYRNDIRLEVVPNDGSYCFKPKNISVLTSDTTNVQTIWESQVQQHEIVWGLHNFVFENGTHVIVNDTTYTFTGLASSTMYDMYLRAICSDSTQSFYIGPFTFYTAQTPAPMPYSCGFEHNDPESSKWIVENGNQFNKWFIGTDLYGYGHYAGNGGLYISYEDENQGLVLGMVNYYNYTNASKVYAFRTFDLEAGPHVVTFKWKCNGEENDDYIRAFLTPASAVLTAGYDNGITATNTPNGWIALGGQLSNDTAWNTYYNEQVMVPVDGYYNLVFYWVNDGSAGNYPAPAIDNVQLFALTCPLPNNLQCTASDISTATIAWTETGSATEWNLEYGVHGFAQGTGTVVSANTNPFTITGLNAATKYDVYVQSVCGTDDLSGWRGPATFNTATCLAYEMCPIYLELTDEVNDGWNNAQLEVYTNGIYINSFTVPNGHNSMNYTVPLCPGTTTLKWRKGAFDNECTFTLYSSDSVMLFSSATGDNYADGQTVFEFQHSCNNNCTPPTGLTTTVGQNKVVVSWTASADATSYNIYRNNTKIVSNITTTTYNDNTIVVNGEYCYKVTSNCDDGIESAPTDESCVTTEFGVEENAAEAARIFPNPTNNKVKVEANGMTRVEVMSILGQRVYVTDLEADEFEFDFGAYEAGVYMLRIETTTGSAIKRVTVVK